MSILFRYPVIDLDPSIRKIFSSYENQHWIDLTSQTAAGFSMGFFINWISRQANPGRKIPRWYIGTSIAGFGVGLMTNWMKISYQFQGYSPNEHLVKRFGALSESQILNQLRQQGLKQPSFPLNSLPFIVSPESSPTKFPIISLFPGTNQIVMNLEKYDYVRIALFGTLFYGVGIGLTKLLRNRGPKFQLDRPVLETIHHFCLLQGLLMGMANEYNNSYLRLLGLAPNTAEQEKYGQLTNILVIREVISNLFPEVDFDSVQFEEVRLKTECIKQLEAALTAKFPNCDISELKLQELLQHSGNENQKVVQLIIAAGYQPPSHLFSE